MKFSSSFFFKPYRFLKLKNFLSQSYFQTDFEIISYHESKIFNLRPFIYCQ